MIDSIAILIKKAALEFDKISNPVLAKYDLTSSQYKILLFLYAQPFGAARVVDLERQYSMTHPTTLGLVDALSEKGFIKRIPNPADARGKLVALTDKANSMREELLNLEVTLDGMLTESLSAGDKQQLVELLQRLLKMRD